MIWKVVRQIARVGIQTEAAPDIGEQNQAEASRIQAELLSILGGALTIREVDAGSCNGCEMEINALGNPYYNIGGLGIKFVASPRLAEPGVNIAYGTRYMRYLIDRYGTVELALAAYNGGPANLNGWLDEARAKGTTLKIPDDIPFTETRGFVSRVMRAVPIYRRAYGDRLSVGSRGGAAQNP